MCEVKNNTLISLSIVFDHRILKLHINTPQYVGSFSEMLQNSPRFTSLPLLWIRSFDDSCGKNTTKQKFLMPWALSNSAVVFLHRDAGHEAVRKIPRYDKKRLIQTHSKVLRVTVDCVTPAFALPVLVAVAKCCSQIRMSHKYGGSNLFSATS